MSFLRDLFSARMPGAVRVRSGTGFATGEIVTLPVCDATSDGEWRWVRGGTGVADRQVVCEKDTTDTYAWAEKGNAALSGAYQPLDTDLTQIAALADPNADRILFWDDSATAWKHLATGSGLAISGTTLATDLDMGTVSGPIVSFVSRPTLTTAVAEFNWVDMPLAATEFLGSSGLRKLVDLTQQTEYLFSAQISVDVGTAGAVLDLEYTTDLTGASGWTTMGGSSLSLAAGGWVNSGWDAVPVGANAVVLLRVVGSGGDGAADPRIVNLVTQFRSPGIQGPAGADGASGSGGGGSLVDILMLGGM